MFLFSDLLYFQLIADLELVACQAVELHDFIDSRAVTLCDLV